MRGIDIPLIDTWPELAQDGYLLPQYDIDGMHLSREAALVSLQKIIRLPDRLDLRNPSATRTPQCRRCAILVRYRWPVRHGRWRDSV